RGEEIILRMPLAPRDPRAEQHERRDVCRDDHGVPQGRQCPRRPVHGSPLPAQAQRARAASSLMGGRRGNDADARKLTALTFCLANEAFEGGWPHLMRRDRLTITSASSRSVALADRRSGDAKV